MRPFRKRFQNGKAFVRIRSIAITLDNWQGWRHGHANVSRRIANSVFFPRKVKGDGKVFAMARLSKLYLSSARRGRFCFFTNDRHRSSSSSSRIYLADIENIIYRSSKNHRFFSKDIRSQSIRMSEKLSEKEFARRSKKVYTVIIVIFISRIRI